MQKQPRCRPKWMLAGLTVVHSEFKLTLEQEVAVKFLPDLRNPQET